MGRLILDPSEHVIRISPSDHDPHSFQLLECVVRMQSAMTTGRKAGSNTAFPILRTLRIWQDRALKVSEL